MLQKQINKTLWQDRISQLKLNTGSIIMMPKPPKGEALSHFTAFLKDLGVNTVISLLEPLESQQLGIASHADLCEKEGIKHLNFPIRDHSTPNKQSEFIAFTQNIAAQMKEKNHNIAIHCYAGIGRTGITAASIMMHLGHQVDMALIQLSKARGMKVPETLDQIQFLHSIDHE